MTIDSQKTYYEATVDRGVCPPLRGRVDTRVCILGGGLAGLSTALGLAERGMADVTVLESHQVGHGASGRNGGFVFGGYCLGNAALRDRLGTEEARRLYGLTVQAVELIRHRVARYGIDCDLVDRGVILANWFDDPARLERPRRLMQEVYGVEWEPVAKRELRDLLKTDRYHGGLLERNAFHFHPLKYVAGVARVLQQQGVRVHEQSRVLRIEPRAGGFMVATEGGEVHAEHVVFAGGGYARGVYRPVERSVMPIATYVMATEPLGERLQAAMACGAAVYDTRFAFDYYRPLPDTRILWGGRISIVDRSPQRIATLLHKDLLRVYPQLEGVRIQHAWGGLMSYARHQMAQIGQDDQGVWYAVGFGGHGMAPTTVAGEVLADALARATRLPRGFGQFGLPRSYGVAGLAAAQLTYTTLQMRDAFDAHRLNRP